MALEYRIAQVCPAPTDMYVVFQKDGEPHSWPADCLLLIEEPTEDADRSYRWVQAVVLSEGQYSPLDIELDRSLGTGRGEFRADDWREWARNRHEHDCKMSQRRTGR